MFFILEPLADNRKPAYMQATLCRAALRFSLK